MFRRMMIRNIYYLKDLSANIVDEIICNLEVKRYAAGSTIIKNGDVSNKLMFLRYGEIDIRVNNSISEKVDETKELLFDTLN